MSGREHGDAVSRARALDPRRSFIVQAPAGSGKTELLIQRYLRLLATVREPEQVVAITFTRKAAAEMRGRVLAAMDEARHDVDAAADYRSVTLKLARAVIDRDEARAWSIRMFPQRLKIGTLDALNTALARQMPLSSGGVATTSVVEDATRDYQQAARRTIDSFSRSTEGTEALERLLREHEGKLARLETMIGDLLATREQWLPVLAVPSADLGAETTAGWRAVSEAKLQRLHEVFPLDLMRQLGPLLQHAAGHAVSPALRSRLAVWSDAASATGALGSSAAPWRGIASLLLTERAAWRKQVGKREGFGPDHASSRKALMGLLERLRSDETVRAALADIAAFPEGEMTQAELGTLYALREILMHAVAELRVGFSERRATDFVELATSAQRALGNSAQPSELLLALDHRIQHILVDEFQDTSRSQIGLLELLTSGWQAGDGRSLFLVGDPMQSIYRFRHADISLFMLAKLFGIGDLRLEYLALSANFRSAPAIVSWINETFAGVFPEEDDIELGVTRFDACEPIRESEREQFVRCHPLATDDLDAELSTVVALITEERRRAPESSIGVLVQSRRHLLGLRSMLRRLPWPIRAVEIDALNVEQVIQDLLALSRSLGHFADKPAWLALLRAPWCGLRWTDIERLAARDSGHTVWERMHDEDVLSSLSGDGRSRLLRTRAVLAAALEHRGHQPFAEWIRLTWDGLGGPETLTRVEQQDKVEQFFCLLDQAGEVEDPAALESLFRRPFPEPDTEGRAGIDIMTIHRAKGLEFDTVILSGLNRVPRPDRARALRIVERTMDDGTTRYLVAPEMRAGSSAATYIRTLEARLDRAERSRLLYVATTRARERLHLVWGMPKNRSEPAPRSLLTNIWHRVGGRGMQAPEAAVAGAREPVWLEPRLRRFSEKHLDDRAPRVAWDTAPGEPDPSSSVEYAWAGQSSIQVGVVVHRYLQLIAETGLSTWDSGRVGALLDVFRAELELLGVEPAGLDTAAERVSSALMRVLADPTGRWLLGPHEATGSEVEIASVSDARLSHLRLDRTFVDEHGIRWIVDFKTGTHEGGELDRFLNSEVERYRPQLERYARAMAEIENREIRVALYYPLLQAFRDWAAGRAGD